MSQRILAGKVSPVIARSWERCLTEYSLQPADVPDPICLNAVSLAERREAASELLALARVETESLYRQMAGPGHTVVFADKDGMVLQCVGDPKINIASSKSDLECGVCWSEASQGTNGIGTALIEKRPVVVHHTEHFLKKNSLLTCSGAPIMDPYGEVIGVLDVSSQSTQAQQHTVALVNMSAQMLENLYFLSCFKERHVIRFHSRPEFVTTLHEGLVSFDEDGTIAAANRAAAFQMDLDDQSRLVDKNIQEVFGWPVSSLIDMAGRHPDDPIELHYSRDGRGFFGIVRRPIREISRHAGQGGSSTDRRLRKDANRDIALDELHYGDPVIANNAETARKIMGCDIPFIIYGKTGTGKGLFAKALHETSQRAGKPFVAVNCAAIPESLIESELFGYKKGAFTGADKQGRRGKILQAQEGTLFLDEIGDMPLALQARLLRVLEEHEVTPLGSEEPVTVDIQVISATHQDLNELVLENKFREDLYYRLQGAAFMMPNLADRLDRRSLILALVERWAATNRKISLEPKALECLEQYGWPGNVRQLCLTLRTILALVEGDKITLNDIPGNIRSKNNMKVGVIYEAGDQDLLEAAERSALLHALESKRWNIAKVARSLNMSRNTLYRKIKRLGIKM